MATVFVNDQEVLIDDNQSLNGIEVARQIGIDIPHYCWHPGLSVVASCRMCLVETGHRDPKTGALVMLPKLAPACQTPAKDGTVFVTNSEKVKAARAMVEEDLLIRHPIDCPICDKAGECHLQDYHFEHGRGERRADIKPFTSRRRPMGDTVTLFVDRCVMCSRCVRFTREVTGTSELMVVNRGAHEEIDVFPGFPLENKLSGNVVDLCPVGALGDKEFLYSQRVWFMRKHDGVCAGCATGCSIHVEENQDHVYRLKPRENPHVNQWWMCDEGRYGYKHIHSERRMTQPFHRQGNELIDAQWSTLPDQVDNAFRQGQRLAAVLSPFLTVEEAYLLCKYVRGIDPNALLSLGPIPREGEDEPFPNGFTIRAEKCPNRRGVEQVLEHFTDTKIAFDDLPEELATDGIEAIWLTGGYKSDWIEDTTAQQLASNRTVIVQDMFRSAAWDLADYQLPGAAFAEREGSYVNHDDRLQSFKWAVRPPAGVTPEGVLYWRLLGRPGLYQARQTLTELASEIGFFANAVGDVPDIGVQLASSETVEA